MIEEIGCEELLEQRGPGADALERAAWLEDAARTLDAPKRRAHEQVEATKKDAQTPEPCEVAPRARTPHSAKAPRPAALARVGESGEPPKLPH